MVGQIRKRNTSESGVTMVEYTLILAAFVASIFAVKPQMLMGIQELDRAGCTAALHSYPHALITTSSSTVVPCTTP